MANQKIIGGRTIGGITPAPAFVAELLELFGSVENVQAYVDDLTAFFASGVQAQTTLDLVLATGTPLEANGRLIRDSLPNSSVEDFNVYAETNLQVSGADFVSELNTSYIYTVI